MHKSNIIKTLFLLSFILCKRLHSQNNNPVFIDKEGVMRWTADKKEAAFFGVNYTVPFAYGFRSHKAIGKDLKLAIDEDVYHFSRLGLDAFRVHMWDVEITDSLGNLLQNEHLELFDYLLYQLNLRNIKTIITPIAFWGNGYPERDEKTIGFSTVYGKGPSVVKDEAIRAQENYLKQLFKHINPYTKKTYQDDPGIIAMEINNEPHHSGSKEKATEYVNRLAAATRSTGWTKPVFYNISESPTYSDAIAKANVDGHSFQWYPSGLVAGREQKGNFLPHVDRYTIPFDSVPAYKNKTRMVYEFDAADILQSNMYPAIARTYRTAGFQWCTQFAYDPLATAYGNTEYQTHYLNLAYTPSKAISLMIASKVFHRVPRAKNYGSYPTDTLFDVFRVSYENSLSEMNSTEEFYYSNTTTTKPVDPLKLKHIAGVGSSTVIQYEGTGAYFLDHIGEERWILEVMPDAIQIRDPFERASPKKEVVRIEWRQNKMIILLPALGEGFRIDGINSGNLYSQLYKPGQDFFISPGSYLLYKPNGRNSFAGTKEFVAPQPFSKDPVVFHTPFQEVSAGKAFNISARVAGIDSADRISVELRSIPRWRNIPLKKTVAGDYTAEIPVEAVTSGILNYRIIIQKKNGEYHVFPGDHKGDPYTWDNTNDATWQTLVPTDKTSIDLFNANADRTQLVYYNPDWRNNSFSVNSSDRSSQLAIKMVAKKLGENQSMGWQFYFGDKIKGRASELNDQQTIVIRLRAANPVNAKLILVTKDAKSFSALLSAGSEWKDIRIPLNAVQPDSFLLVPRPYPGFLPLWFRSGATAPFSAGELEKIQVICYGEGKQVDLEIASVWLEKQ